MGRLLLLFEASFLLGLVYLAGAYDFYVGNRDGWVLKPAESYNLWSSRRRFLVNDNLFFKYKTGEASVLLVNKEDYDSCRVDDPIKKFDDGNTVFKLDRTGPFFFIDGEPDHCLQGQKLTVVVISARKQRPPPVTPMPAPVAKPPTSPPSVSPVSASPLQAPTAEPPTSLTAPSPSYASPLTAPVANPPTSSPSASPASPASSISVPPTSDQSPAHSPLGVNNPLSSPAPAPAPTPTPSSATGIAVSRFFLGMLALFACEALLN